MFDVFDSLKSDMATQYEMVQLHEVGSTQDAALERLIDGSAEAVILSTERQTSGRGRSGRPWIHAPRAIAVSVAFTPDATMWPVEKVPVIALTAGLAARAILDDSVRLKWPNDVMLDGRKAGGVLAERHDGNVVVGLGINLWWPSAPDGMIGVFGKDPGAEAAQVLAERWAVDVLARQHAGPDDWGRTEYLAVCETIGQDIVWDQGRGRAVSVDDSGGLVVETMSGTVTIRSGEVNKVRPATIPAASDPQEPPQ